MPGCSSTATISRPCGCWRSIGMAHEVLDDAELLLAAVLQLAPDYRTARHDYAGVLVERHRYAQARGELDRLLRDDPDNRALSHAVRGEPRWASASTSAPSDSTGAAHRDAADAEVHLSIGHALKTLGRTRRGHRVLPPRGRAAGRTTAMPTGASPTSRPTASRLRRSRACAPASAAPATGDRRSLPPVLCARQGARGPGRVSPSRSATTSAATR